jgi:thiol:disulfide interchange protein DsbD
MVGAAGGGNDVLQPLRGVSFAGGAGTGTAPSSEKLPFVRIKGIAGLEQALATAKAHNKAVMLDFYADWCISCKEMEKYTFSNPDVRAALSGMILLQSDVTANDEQDQALLKHFGLFGPPSMIFFGPDGRERRDHRLVGFLKPDKFRAHIESFKSSL